MTDRSAPATDSGQGWWRRHLLEIFYGAASAAVYAGLAWVVGRRTVALAFAVLLTIGLIGGLQLLLTRNSLRGAETALNTALERIAEAQQPRHQGLHPTATTPKLAIPREARVIGLDIGRSRITYTVFRSSHPLEFGLSGHKGFDEPRHEQIKLGPEIYTRIVQIICGVASGLDHLDGVGFGLPGQVDASEGAVIASPGGLSPNEPFVATLAERVVENDFLRRLLVRDPLGATDVITHEVRTKLLVDNDANCAARGILNAHVQDDQWQNFACLVLGSGVGAGLVLNRELYYGTGGAAGEVGHMAVDTQRLTLLGGPLDSVQYRAVACACGFGHDLVHWESLVSGPGLVHMLTHALPRLHDALTRQLARAPTAKDIWLLARTDMFGAATSPETEPYKTILGDNQLRIDARRLLELHARYLAIGVANVVNLLNLDHVVLAGGVANGLMTLPWYRTAAVHELEQLLLEKPSRTLATPLLSPLAEQRGAGCNGAALIFVDPSYKRQLGRRAIPPSTV